MKKLAIFGSRFLVCFLLWSAIGFYLGIYADLSLSDEKTIVFIKNVGLFMGVFQLIVIYIAEKLGLMRWINKRGVGQ